MSPILHMTATMLFFKFSVLLLFKTLRWYQIHLARSQAILMVVLEAPTTYLTSLASFLTSWPPHHSWNMTHR